MRKAGQDWISMCTKWVVDFLVEPTTQATMENLYLEWATFVQENKQQNTEEEEKEKKRMVRLRDSANLLQDE